MAQTSDPVRPRLSRGMLVCGSPVIVDRAPSPTRADFTGSLILGMVRVLLDVGRLFMMQGSCWMLGPMRCQLLVRSWISQVWCQVLVGSRTPHAKLGSCWMLGLMRCHWLLLDLGYLMCGVRFLLGLGYLACGVIFLLGRGHLTQRQVLVGCWVPYDVTGSC